MSKLSELFRARLKSAFESRGARADFVRKTGIAQNTVYLWTTGERIPDLDQVELAAEALGTTPASILFTDRPASTVKDPTLRELITRIASMEEDELSALLDHVRIVSDVMSGQLPNKLSPAKKKTR